MKLKFHDIHINSQADSEFHASLNQKHKFPSERLSRSSEKVF